MKCVNLKFDINVYLTSSWRLPCVLHTIFHMKVYQMIHSSSEVLETLNKVRPDEKVIVTKKHNLFSPDQC